MGRRVVITGMGAITPLGNNVETTWKKLLQGKSGVDRISRFDPEGFSTQIAGEIKDFDPGQYVDKREAKRMDPFVHYGLAAAFQAWEQAGFKETPPDPESVGVLVGSGIGGLGTLEEQHSSYLEKGSRRISPFFVPMMIGNMAAGNISIKLGLKGPVTSIVSACATGTDAIGAAFRSIAWGDAEVMVAGGTEASITPMGLGGFCSARALSTRNEAPAQASRPFDAERDGFVMSEGAGIVVMETLERATQRGAEILAEIKGYGSVGDAYHQVQPDPQGDGGARAMARAINDAGWDPQQVDYINAHGTSTEYNDRLETGAIKRVCGEQAYKMVINSSKSMLGHLLGAAGGIEFIITVKSLQEGQIHPTINLTNPDPDCDLDYVSDGVRQVEINRALTNSLGFGGHNATLAVEKWVD